MRQKKLLKSKKSAESKQEHSFVKIFLPSSITREQRNILSQILVRVAEKFHFSGMHDWDVQLTAKDKVLGIESEFHDLSTRAEVSAPFQIYFPSKKFALQFSKIVILSFPELRVSAPSLQANKDWMRIWRKHYKPVKIEASQMKKSVTSKVCWIIPAWQKPSKEVKKSLWVKIHPGQAFGTGTHPTTSLCIRAYLEYGRFDFLQTKRHGSKKIKILDFGAGTGILGIAAARDLKRENKKSVIDYVEIDSVAREQLKKNIALNREVGRVLKNPVSAKKYHWIFANVLSPVLLDKKEFLMDSLENGGVIVLSGILAKESKKFLKEFLMGQSLGGDVKKNIQVLEHYIEKDWAGIVLKRGIV